MPTVTIVDDHQVVAEGFARLVDAEPEFTTLAVLGSGESLLEQMRNRRIPDLCVRDLSMPGVGGGDILRTLYPNVKVLMNLNAKTVSTYRARVLRKLNLQSNAELIAYCLRRGLVTIADT
jgi:DNA-binding NarL/FixJ family response regulator